MVTPIACSQPSAALLNRSGHSGLMDTKNPGDQKKTRAGESRPLALSTFVVLRPPTPGVGLGKGGHRVSLPPELPAGKRGGWHHDSVYPSFRLTSFAPRALNFEASVPAQGRTPTTTKLMARCLGVRPRRPSRVRFPTPTLLARRAGRGPRRPPRRPGPRSEPCPNPMGATSSITRNLERPSLASAVPGARRAHPCACPNT